jgi:hypothetical protein
MLSPEQIEAIPLELRQLTQWVGAQNKIPINPRTYKAASSTDPSTWGTFQEAMDGLFTEQYTHIGLVFTETDPYLFIDLDAAKGEDGNILPATDPMWIEQDKRSMSWVQAFQSYTERSQSGQGYHIIVKAKVDNAVKIKGMEMYYAKRYAIFTGNVLIPAPIYERQGKVDEAVSALKLAKRIVIENPNAKFDQPVLTDDMVLTKIANAANSEAVRLLWEGKWHGDYPSQSEADHALLAHLAFYSGDDKQVARLFRQSNLGQRQKANNPRDPYVESSIQNIRKYQPQPIDFTNFKVPPPKDPPPRVVNRSYPRPPDVLGDLADFIYGASIHPVKEVAYAGAISWCAGVMGRHFNISHTGLNQYILLLAGTGKGKEGASDGIDLIYQTLRPHIPEVETFRGPSNLASGPALVRMLGEKEIPSVLAIVGEFGLRLCAMTDPRANAAEVTLKAALLDLFSKSGEFKTLSPIVYSDSLKNTKLLDAPAFSMLGVSTPETFFDKLTEASVMDGLVPRFLTIVYQGGAQIGSKSRNLTMDPTLLAKLLKAVETAIYMSRNSTYCHIPMTDAATKLLDAFEAEVVKRMNAMDGECASMSLLNRAHLKALRLAGLAAAMGNPSKPQVTEIHAKWAIEFVEVDMAYISSRFERGDVGEGDAKQMNVLREKLRSFFNSGKPPTKDPKWLAMLAKGVIPYSLISQKLISVSCFANDRRGASAAIAACLKELANAGEVREIPTQQVTQEFGTSSKAYVLIEG